MKRLPELRRKLEYAKASHTFVVLDCLEAEYLIALAEQVEDSVARLPEEDRQVFQRWIRQLAEARVSGADST